MRGGVLKSTPCITHKWVIKSPLVRGCGSTDPSRKRGIIEINDTLSQLAFRTSLTKVYKSIYNKEKYIEVYKSI